MLSSHVPSAFLVPGASTHWERRENLMLPPKKLLHNVRGEKLNSSTSNMEHNATWYSGSLIKTNKKNESNLVNGTAKESREAKEQGRSLDLSYSSSSDDDSECDNNSVNSSTSYCRGRTHRVTSSLERMAISAQILQKLRQASITPPRMRVKQGSKVASSPTNDNFPKHIKKLSFSDKKPSYRNNAAVVPVPVVSHSNTIRDCRPRNYNENQIESKATTKNMFNNCDLNMNESQQNKESNNSLNEMIPSERRKLVHYRHEQISSSSDLNFNRFVSCSMSQDHHHYPPQLICHPLDHPQRYVPLPPPQQGNCFQNHASNNNNNDAQHTNEQREQAFTLSNPNIPTQQFLSGALLTPTDFTAYEVPSAPKITTFQYPTRDYSTPSAIPSNNIVPPSNLHQPQFQTYVFGQPVSQPEVTKVVCSQPAPNGTQKMEKIKSDTPTHTNKQPNNTTPSKPIKKRSLCTRTKSTPHHPPLTTPKRQKTCRMDTCHLPAAKRTPYCHKHSGVRKCEHAGCTKCAQGRTRFCIAHGGGRRCTVAGCTKAARDRKFCAAHGGGKRCEEEGCHKSAVGGTGRCTAHGGGRRCQAVNCGKSAQSKTDFCVKHGGGRRCTVDGCQKVARGRSALCMSHATLGPLGSPENKNGDTPPSEEI